MGKSENPEGGPSRRKVMFAAAGAAAMAAIGQAAVTPASAAVPADAGTGPLVRGGSRQYAKPRIAPGHRLVLPEGAVVLEQGAKGPAAAEGHRWPVAPRGGHAVNLGVMAPDGAPTQNVVVAGFPDRAWYEVRDARGHVVDRCDWDGRRMPYLRMSQEWGATKEFPYYGQFYAMGLEPFSSAA